MPAEYRPRAFPLVNPEHVTDVLRRLVAGWDTDDEDAFRRALVEARRLLGVPEPAAEVVGFTGHT